MHFHRALGADGDPEFGAQVRDSTSVRGEDLESMGRLGAINPQFPVVQGDRLLVHDFEATLAFENHLGAVVEGKLGDALIKLERSLPKVFLPTDHVAANDGIVGGAQRCQRVGLR